MQVRWVKVGPTQARYCEIATDDSGMVYLSFYSGAVRTSDYLALEDAERLGHAILDTVRSIRDKQAAKPEPEEACEWCGRSFPKSEMNSIEWGGDPNRVKRICDHCCDEGN